MSKSPAYTQTANQYAQDVLSGAIPACKWVKLACQRHLDDLAASADPDCAYTFSAAKANRACTFLEQLHHVKGKWSRKKQKLKLEAWQTFIVCCIFGWLECSTKLRRFREALIMVPRKNGKTFLAAGIGLYMLMADAEAGAEVYNGANSLAQAMEVFKAARQMCLSDEQMLSAMGITVNAQSLVIDSTNSSFRPVIGRPPDGSSPSCGIGDEAHEWNTPDLYDTFRTGMMSREQPLLLIISTAGIDLASPCYDLQQQAQKVLEKSLEDDRLFGIIYTIDDGDDWTAEAALIKANPNYGVSIEPKTIQRDQQTAIANAAKQNIFKVKNLNIWTTAAAAWINSVEWSKAADAKLDDFAGEPCFYGLDVASKIDLTATVRLFRKLIDGKVHYYCFPSFYISSQRVNDPKNKHFQKWAAEGYLTQFDEIESSVIAESLAPEAQRYAIKELCFDQYHADYITQPFAQATGVPLFKVPQSPQYLSDPAKELESAIINGRFHHDGNPVMTWCVSNCHARYNSHDNLVIEKDRPNSPKSIDGVDALLNALYRTLLTPVDVPAPKRSMRITFFN